MIKDIELRQEYYQAFITRDSHYEGIFFAGITSTNIVCRPTCSARIPKFDHCVFFKTANEAFLAGYRACKKCTPQHLPNILPVWMQHIVAIIDKEPHKIWSKDDIKQLGISDATLRRYFKKHFGMSFAAYVRTKRIDEAAHMIRDGDSVINAQLHAGYESDSGFREAFANILRSPPSRQHTHIAYIYWLQTPLGSMLAISDDDALYLLEFADRKNLEQEILTMRKVYNMVIIPGRTVISDIVERELNQYFVGDLQHFTIPITYKATDFKQQVWQALQTIPYGETRSYAQQAVMIGNKKAVRAVANANGANQFAIIIPCHRVIGSDGSLTGYAAGVARKQWLLEHEQYNAII